MHNVFTKENNKINLSSNDDKRIQFIDSIETCAYGTSKDLVSEKEEIKCYNIIKQYKQWLRLMKTWINIIQIDHKSQIIHTEY